MVDTHAALFEGEPSAARAIFELYGTDLIGESASTAADRLTSLFVKLNFRINGQDRLSVLLKTKKIDPVTGAPINCHVCSVSLSAVDYMRSGKQWVKVGQSLEFAELGNWGEAIPGDSIDIKYDLAPSTTAFLFDDGGSGQGYYNVGKSILALENAQWKSLGYISTGEDNSGNCEEELDPKNSNDTLKPCWKSKGTCKHAVLH